MDLPKAPCEANQVIYFDAENLKFFLQFLESSNLKAHININDLKMKVLEIDDIRKDINDIYLKMDFFNERF